ncbi:hypothetical protein Z948_2485 [Sulfitobacter donghicola DSW-25 = KCTC 12864 = JCM 14565]|nr:hypothetical protein Z948_2485 [Sulfitobacter donghicola DSW-25 = KCTC 12864 = JCM 14565]
MKLLKRSSAIASVPFRNCVIHSSIDLVRNGKEAACYAACAA